MVKLRGLKQVFNVKDVLVVFAAKLL